MFIASTELPPICMYNMDGNNKRCLRETYGKPQSLSVHPSKNLLYWFCPLTKSIYYVDYLSTSEPPAKLKYLREGVTSVAVKDGYVYWTSNQTNLFVLRNHVTHILHLPVSGNIEDIMPGKVSFSSPGNSLDRNMPACSKDNGGCSFMCLTSGAGRTCICETGMVLSGDNMTCITMPCEDEQFRCDDNSTCLPQSLRCDEKEDCDDGSDEKNCETFDQKPMSCIAGDFHCKNGQCILPSWRCDGKNDCADNSDEDDCRDPCLYATCQQNCRNTPEGPECYCNIGYNLNSRNNKTCNDINECETDGFCSHHCKNLPGSFECSCLNGYELVDRSCLAAGGDPLLVFTTLDEVRGMYLRSNYYFIIRRAINKVVAVDVDSVDQIVYWIELSKNSTIYSSKIDGGNFKSILNYGLLIPEDLAVDYLAKNLYITDSGLKQVIACRADGTMCSVLHKTNIENPRSVAVDPSEGFLYWSDWGNSTAGIYRSGMDGSNRISMVSTNIKWPNGIALDHTVNRLYWVDAKLRTIEYVSLDGRTRNLLIKDAVNQPFSLSVFEDEIFWTDWKSFSLDTCNKFTGHDMKTLIKESSNHIMGVHVYHPVLESKVINPCWSHNCSHMCLIAPGPSYRCVCSEGFVLSTDGKSCEIRNYQQRCSGNDFQCKKGNCILFSWRCDGKNDCGDNSDEEDCHTCLKEHFICANGECVPEFWRCDGDGDCTDGSDELNCHETKCDLKSHIRCDHGQCIPISWVCDRMNDCYDATDEKNCTDIKMKACSSKQFKCEEGTCIDLVLHCDGKKDCEDGSDEKNCSRPAVACTQGMFSCKDENCIYNHEVCDGHIDCANGEDEADCPVPLCHQEGFLCPKTKKCILRRFVCDGDLDCEEGTDEENCPPMPTYPPYIPGSAEACDGSYCYSTGHCLPWSKVCDGRKDCDDILDEGGKCSIACLRNGGCSQICKKTPRGPLCSCNHGYRLLQDNVTCEDVNECEIPGSCSHLCINEVGGFRCSCFQGYSMHYDNRTCKADGPPATLMISTGNQIRGLDLFSYAERVYVNLNYTEISGMDFDTDKGIIYWTEYNQRTINSYTIGTGRYDVIFKTDGRPAFVKWDWIAKNLYYTDHSGHVYACTDGKYCNSLIIPREEISGFDISPTTGLMFWSVMQQQGTRNGLIEKAVLDGSHILTIVSSDIGWPTTIAVDHTLNRIYWLDVQTASIDSSDFHGLERRKVLAKKYNLPSSWAFFEDYIYWNDAETNFLERCNKFTERSCIKIKSNVQADMLMVVHEVLQKQGKNVCENSNCDQLSLPGLSHCTCKCADNYVRDGDICKSYRMKPNYVHEEKMLEKVIKSLFKEKV